MASTRGKNYTEREKCSLLSIIDRHKSIIENKNTNALSIVKKKETWEKITASYNASAEVPRTQKQLQTVYINLKRESRKTVADENVKQYLIRNTDRSDNNYEDIIKKLKKDQSTDKKEIRATGGGTYKPLLNESGAQILAIMGSQVKPLANSCDSASEYYVTVETTDQNQVNHEENSECYEIENNICEQNGQDNNSARSPAITSPIRQRTDSTSRLRATRILKTKKRQIRNSDNLKKKYYQKKLESAIIEKKLKLVKYKSAITEQRILDLDIKIKRLEYGNLLKKT